MEEKGVAQCSLFLKRIGRPGSLVIGKRVWKWVVQLSLAS